MLVPVPRPRPRPRPPAAQLSARSTRPRLAGLPLPSPPPPPPLTPPALTFSLARSLSCRARTSLEGKVGGEGGEVGGKQGPEWGRGRGSVEHPRRMDAPALKLRCSHPALKWEERTQQGCVVWLGPVARLLEPRRRHHSNQSMTHHHHHHPNQR